MISAIQIALSGLFAASKKVDAAASNIANLQTAGSLEDPDNAPYTPLTTSQKTITGSDGSALGVKADLVAKTPAFVPTYAPDSPFANEDGVIGMPNVDIAEEAVNMMIASDTYKANAAIIRTSSEMENDILNMFDKKA